MEFTLPIFLKLFPNMLPSTFKEADKEVLMFLVNLMTIICICVIARKIEETN
jgi:hypothetical protein